MCEDAIQFFHSCSNMEYILLSHAHNGRHFEYNR